MLSRKEVENIPAFMWRESREYSVVEATLPSLGEEDEPAEVLAFNASKKIPLVSFEAKRL